MRTHLVTHQRVHLYRVHGNYRKGKIQSIPVMI